MLGFYETPARLEAKAKAIGLDLEGLCRSGALEIMWRSPSDNLVDELAWEIVERARAKKAKRVFVDGVIALRDSLIFSERLPNILNALNSYLRELGASVLYTSEIREMHAPEALPTDEVSMIVDNVLMLAYLRRERALRRSLSIVKLRDSDFDPRTKEFHVKETGITFGPDPDLGDAGLEVR